MKPHEFFDQIYCINLSKRKDRWLQVTSRLKQVGIEPLRWEALDGDILGWISEGGKNYIGCAISHLMAMVHAKYNNYNRILIFEDDVCPYKNFEAIFEQFYLQQQGLNWGMFYLGFIPLSDDWSHWDYSVIMNNFVRPNVIKATRHLSGAYAYALQGKFIDFVLNTLGKNAGLDNTYYTVDSWMQKKYLDQANDVFAFVPQLFAHDNSYSDNTCSAMDRLTRSICVAPENYIV